MKTLKVTLEVEVKGDESDEEGIKENLYQHLTELIETDELFDKCTVVDANEDEDSFLDEV